MFGEKFTTAEAAREVGIHISTLQRWIASGRVKAPEPALIGAVGYRLWSAEDIENLRAVKKDLYWKRDRKQKNKKNPKLKK